MSHFDAQRADEFEWAFSTGMITIFRKLIILSLCATYVIGQLGCATGPKKPVNLSESKRARLATIGVVSARFLPEAEFQMPAAGPLGGIRRGAQAGAVKGADVIARLGPLGGDPFGAATVLYLGLLTAAATVGSVAGATYGMVAAEPAQKVAETEATLRQALAKLHMQEAILDQVSKEAQRKTNYSYLVLSKDGPASRGEGKNYVDLRNKGVDTVLELSVLSLQLDSEPAINPPLTLSMTVGVRLIAVLDNSVLYDFPFTYQSRPRSYTEWAVNEAQPFREELDRAYQDLAEKIVYDLFLLYPLPVEEFPEGHYDNGWPDNWLTRETLRPSYFY